MKSQPISSYHFSEMPTMPIPQALKDEMEKRGIKPNPLNIRPTNFGIEMPKHKPMQERDLSTEELLNLFDRKESLTLAYIPHFITQCVIYYLDLLVDYARANRLSEYKKHTRMLKNVREEYFMALRHEMPPHVYQRFLEQRDEYLNLCGANLQLMYFTFGNELSKKYGRQNHEAMLCYANIMVAFVEYVEDFDRKVNAKIAEKMGMPCRNHGDARLTAIKTICKDILHDYPIPKNNDTELCVNVMANKAKAMINNML